MIWKWNITYSKDQEISFGRKLMVTSKAVWLHFCQRIFSFVNTGRQWGLCRSCASCSCPPNGKHPGGEQSVNRGRSTPFLSRVQDALSLKIKSISRKVLICTYITFEHIFHFFLHFKFSVQWGKVIFSTVFTLTFMLSHCILVYKKRMELFLNKQNYNMTSLSVPGFYLPH